MKAFKYMWLGAFLLLSLYILVDTPNQIKNDAKENQATFKRAVNFIDSFKIVQNRLPVKKEFNAWLRGNPNFFDSTITTACNDTVIEEEPFSLEYQYLRDKNDSYFEADIPVDKIDWCENYVLSKWNGDFEEFYFSWDKNYSHNYSWKTSFISVIIYVFIGFLPFSASKILDVMKSAMFLKSF